MPELCRCRSLLPAYILVPVAGDERLLPLVERYFSLGDVLAVWKRMIGNVVGHSAH